MIHLSADQEQQAGAAPFWKTRCTREAEALQGLGEPLGFEAPPKHESESGHPLVRGRVLPPRQFPNTDIMGVFIVAQNGTAEGCSL